MLTLHGLIREVEMLSNHPELRRFIENYKAENFLFDRKFDLSDKHTAKTIASFANMCGGIIAFGVHNDGKIEGLPLSYEAELLKKIGEKISAAKPRIPSSGISIIKRIKFGDPEKAVFFILIKPSLRKYKPHFVDEKIPLRGNGATDFVESGDQLRDLFHPPPFNPYHIEQVESDLHALKGFRLNQTGLPVLSFSLVKQHIEAQLREAREHGADQASLMECLRVFREVERTIQEILMQQFRAMAEPGAITMADLEEQLSSQVDRCIEKYGELVL